MVQRFDQTEQLQIGSTSTGASGGLMALSQRFDQLRQQAMQIAETEVVQTATREGMEAFKPGEKPEFKDEEVFFGRTGAKAFNQGLRTQYLASLSNDIRKDLAAIQTENPNDVQAFTEQASAVRAALQQEVDPSVLPQVLSQFDQYATNSQITVAKNQFETKRQESISQTNEAINNIGADAARLARSGDMVAAQQSLQEVRTHLDNAVEAGFMTQAESNDSFKSLQREAIEQENKGKFDTLAETEGFEAAFEKLDEISSKVPKGWTPDQWDKYIVDQQSTLNRKLNRQVKEAKATKAEIEKQKNFADIESRVAGNERIVVDAKAADQYYQERVLPQIENMPPEQRQAVTAEYIDALKVVPSSVKNQTSSFIRSGNPELMAEASQMVDRLDETPGVADDIVSPNERAFAKITTDLMQNMEPQEAVRLAMQATDPKDKARIDAVNASLKEEIKDPVGWSQDKASSVYTNFFGIGPEPNPMTLPQMGKEYNDAYRAYRQAGMDDTQAQDAAKGVIQRNWSEFNGTVMKYSPWQYYTPADGDNEYIMDQLVSDVNTDNFSDIPRENIILVSDDETARKASLGKPDYRVKVIQPSGELFTYPDGFRWAPDMQGELERRKAENATQALDRRKKHMETQIKNEQMLRSGLESL